MGLDRSRLGVDFEEGEIVAGHVGAEEPEAIGGDGQILGAFAEAGIDVEKGKLAIVGDFVGGNGVVAAIGTVEEFAVGGDFEIGGMAGSLEVGGDGGDGVAFDEHPRFGEVFELSDGVGEFVDDVEPFSVGVEGKVPGAGLGRSPDEGLSIGGEGAFRGVKLVDQNLIEPEVCGVDIFVVGADDGAVGVGGGLAFGNDAGALVLHECGGFLQRAIGIDGVGSNAAGGVVGDGEGFAGVIDIEVAGGRSERGLTVEEFQGTRISVEGEGCDLLGFATAELAGGVDGVEKLLIGGKSEEERVLDFGVAMNEIE